MHVVDFIFISGGFVLSILLSLTESSCDCTSKTVVDDDDDDVFRVVIVRWTTALTILCVLVAHYARSFQNPFLLVT